MFYRIILLCKSLTENLVCLYNGKHACNIDKTHLRLHENIVSFLNNNRCSYVHFTILISFQKDQGRRMGIQTDTRKHLCLNLYERFDLFDVIYHHLYSLTHAHTHTRTHARAPFWAETDKLTCTCFPRTKIRHTYGHVHAALTSVITERNI